MNAYTETCALCAELIPEDPCEMDWLPSAWVNDDYEIGPICPACAASKTRVGADGETEMALPPEPPLSLEPPLTPEQLRYIFG